jgi:hypothetical protein
MATFSVFLVSIYLEGNGKRAITIDIVEFTNFHQRQYN